MKIKKISKVISLLLTVSLLASVLPTTAYAVSGDNEGGGISGLLGGGYWNETMTGYRISIVDTKVTIWHKLKCTFQKSIDHLLNNMAIPCG